MGAQRGRMQVGRGPNRRKTEARRECEGDVTREARQRRNVQFVDRGCGTAGESPGTAANIAPEFTRLAIDTRPTQPRMSMGLNHPAFPKKIARACEVAPKLEIPTPPRILPSWGLR